MTPSDDQRCPRSLRPGDVFEHRFDTREAGEVWAGLTLAAPETSWLRGNSAVLRLDVDGRERQELILAAGDEETEYCRVLGTFPAGPHVLRLGVDEGLSSPDARETIVAAVRIGCIGDADPIVAVWRHAPVLHYRALTSPLDSLTTDTPLLLFYRWRRSGGRLALEYHVIFSHEDAGTDLPGLLARWGHTVDIEWVVRVTLDDAGRVLAEEFQGPDHTTLPYRGGRTMGDHPVVQVATLNGTLSDRPTCPYRVALAPVCAQPAGEPREGVLQSFPWIYRVSAQEVLRQVPLETPASPDSPAPADPRSYVFLQWNRRGGPAVPLEAGVRIGSGWYTSAWGRPAFGFADPDAESTAVKVPAGTTEERITAIALHALADPSDPAEVRFVRAFMLGDDYRPRRPFASSASSAACRLTAGAPRCVAWQR